MLGQLGLTEPPLNADTVKSTDARVPLLRSDRRNDYIKNGDLAPEFEKSGELVFFSGCIVLDCTPCLRRLPASRLRSDGVRMRASYVSKWHNTRFYC